MAKAAKDKGGDRAGDRGGGDKGAGDRGGVDRGVDKAASKAGARAGEKSGKKRDGKRAKAGPEAPALARSPSHLLRRATQFSLDLFDEAAGAGLTQRQFAVLAAVEAREHPTQTDLVRMTGIDRSTLAEMVSRMLARGLLDRERSAADARANVVALTDAGREALREAEPRMARADERLLSVLGGGKRKAFVDALAKLARAAEAAQPDGPDTVAEIASVAGKGGGRVKRKNKADAEGAPVPAKPAKSASRKGAKPKAVEPPFDPPRLVAPDAG